MFNFRNITAKFGNMRKAQEFTICEGGSNEDGMVTLQSDKRIAKVNLNAESVILSDGKGGHQGWQKLSPVFGAKQYACPDSVINELKAMIDAKPIAEGPIRIMG